MYHEFANDPKVQRMSEAMQRRLVMLMCLRSSNGDETLHDDDVAFQLRISNDEWNETKAVFVEKEFIDQDNNLLNWDKRQYVSDSSTARVRAHRKKQKQQCNVSETPPDTDTDTDTEQKEGKARERAPAPKGTRFDVEALPDDWRAFASEFEDCDADTEFERFGNYWRAKSGKDATKLDWFATWRNWILRDHKRKPENAEAKDSPPPNPNHARVWKAIGPANYTAWIATRAKEVTDSQIVIDTDFHRNYVREKFGDQLRKAGFEVTDGLDIPDFLRKSA